VEAEMERHPDLELRTERFRVQHQDEAPVERSFEVECAVSGNVVTVPIGRSILDVLDEEGIVLDSSCREGTCGTCETIVVSGTPDHRDSVLTAKERAENDTMMVCVSRSLGDQLVLEI
jgi:ferredoxin